MTQATAVPQFTCKSGLCHTARIDGDDVVIYDAGCPTCHVLESRYIPQPAFADERPISESKKNTATGPGKGEI